MARKSPAWWMPVLLLLLAFGLRVLGIDHGQPPSGDAGALLPTQTPLHPDEYLLVALPADMRLRASLNPGFYEYPSGLIYLNYGIQHMTGALSPQALAARTDADLRALAPFPLYVMGRFWSVLGGVLSVAGVYAIGRRAFSAYGALAAALLTAVSFPLVQHAHYAKPGIPATGLMMLSAWAAFAALYAHHPRRRDALLLLGGILCGAATTTRYNALSMGIVLGLVGLVLLYRQRTRRMAAVVIASWLMVPLVFVVGTPYALVDFQAFADQFAYIAGQFLSTATNVPDALITDRATGLYLLLRYLLVVGLGIPAALIACLGFVTIAIHLKPGLGPAFSSPAHNQRLDVMHTGLVVAILLIFIGAYALVALRVIRPVASDNLLLLILPACALLVGWGAQALYERFRSPWVAALLLAVIIAVPLLHTAQALRLFTTTDTRYIMQRWIETHIPPGASMTLLGPYNVPLDDDLYDVTQVFWLPGGVDRITGDYVVFSDARLLEAQRAAADLGPSDQRWLALQGALAETGEARYHVPRPAWVGWDDLLTMMRYWHHPGLTIYCWEACR